LASHRQTDLAIGRYTVVIRHDALVISPDAKLLAYSAGGNRPTAEPIRDDVKVRSLMGVDFRSPAEASQLLAVDFGRAVVGDRAATVFIREAGCSRRG